jgi:hypothetical protein
VTGLAAVGGHQTPRPVQVATNAIPIVSGIPESPVKEGPVPNLNRPGANVTGATFLPRCSEQNGCGCCVTLSRSPRWSADPVDFGTHTAPPARIDRLPPCQANDQVPLRTIDLFVMAITSSI